MKISVFFTLSTLFLFCFFSYAARANEKKRIIISGKYKSEEKLHIILYKPVNNYYNQFFSGPEEIETTNTGAGNTFHCTERLEQPATFLLHITDDDKNFLTKSVLILFPGDSVCLDITDMHKTQYDIEYRGSNAEGHRLFNLLDLNPVDKFQPLFSLFDDLHANRSLLINKTEEAVRNISGQFESLYTKSFISQHYSEYAKDTYKLLLYDFVVEKTMFRMASREHLMKNERDSIIEYFYQQLPATSAHVLGLYNSFLYILKYHKYQAYKKLHASFPEDLDKEDTFRLKNSLVSIGNQCAQFLHMTNRKKAEDLWAIFMISLMNFTEPHTFDKEIDQFKAIFPGSRWARYLADKQHETAQVEEVVYQLSTPIEYLDKSSSTLQAVLGNLPPGKPVMIDLWASWCAPCIKAFQYNVQVDTLLLHNNILKLYISIDDARSESQWRDNIIKYKLGGYHFIANSQFINDLRNRLKMSAKEPFSIPRYILVNGHGDIVLKNASGPLSMKLFREEILTYLSGNRSL